MLRYAEVEHRTDKAAMRTFADIFRCAEQVKAGEKM